MRALDGSHLWTKTRTREGIVYNLNRDHAFLDILIESLDSDQKRLLENYLRLAEENLPLNQLYVDLNNEERVNVRKEKEAEKEAVAQISMYLENISSSPDRDTLIQVLMQTDPFCNYKSIVEMLRKELGSEHE